MMRLRIIERILTSNNTRKLNTWQPLLGELFVKPCQQVHPRIHNRFCNGTTALHQKLYHRHERLAHYPLLN
jgi:hypothetical protein